MPVPVQDAVTDVAPPPAFQLKMPCCGTPAVTYC